MVAKGVTDQINITYEMVLEFTVNQRLLIKIPTVLPNPLISTSINNKKHGKNNTYQKQSLS